MEGCPGIRNTTEKRMKTYYFVAELGEIAQSLIPETNEAIKHVEDCQKNCAKSCLRQYSEKGYDR